MARRKPQRPKTPQEILAEKLLKRAMDLEAVNLPPDAAELPNQEPIEVIRAGEKRDGQKVDHDSARRLDAFEALKAGMAAGCYDAARRFELDLMTRRGENDRGRSTERVDRTAGLITDAQIAAAERVEAVVDRIPPRDWWLLMELISPSRDYDDWRPTYENDDGEIVNGEPIKGWRAIVCYITGETHVHAQGAAVRAACVNLRDAYAAIERRAAA